ERAARHLLADPAEAEDAERLAGELDAAVARTFPAAGAQGGVRLRDVAREREQEADRVLGRGEDGRGGRIGDDDAAPRRRSDVDVVDADARPADDAEPLAALDQVGRQLRRRADDDRVVRADDRREVGLEVDVDVEALAEELDAGLGDPLADEDLHTGAPSAYASSARVTATPRSISAPASVSASSTAPSAVAMSNTS